jgi:enediyne biosynthesis protein E4
MRWSIFAAVATGITLPLAAQDTPEAPKPSPVFLEQTSASGLTHKFTGEWEFMVGGGVASFDCNGDAKPDLLLSGGTSPSTFFVNQSPVRGDLKFTRQMSGLEMDMVSGAYPLDMDSDGLMDIVMLRVGENKVMRGLGNCLFSEANKDWGFDGGDAWSTAFAATWEKGAEWPTIAIGNYIDRTQEAFPWGSCTDNWLHRGQADGFALPLPLKPSYCALPMIFTDWNRSGTSALRVSNDREYYKGGEEQLWHLNPGQPPRLYSAEEGWARLRIWGMGIASRDITGDGLPDYFLTSMADSKFQSLPKGPDIPAYADLAWAKGLTAHRPYMGDDKRPSTGWHAQFEDVNNDGLADLFVAKGNVWDMPDFAKADPNNLLMQKADGTFVEAGETAGMASPDHAARGAAMADFNLDGLVDLVVVNRNSLSQIWLNTTKETGHWAQVQLTQDAPNPDAIGAWIEVRQGESLQRRENFLGGGHAGGQAGWVHFGLGAIPEAEVRVIWPDGTIGQWQKIAQGFSQITKDKAIKTRIPAP